MMSQLGSFLSEEQFQCSICLDLYTNPSTTPCGHNFCMPCIGRYWDSSKVCQCPLCKKTFQMKPEMQINRTLKEITEQFKAMQGGVRGRVGGGEDKERRVCGVGGWIGRGRAGAEGGGLPENLYDELRKRFPRAPLKTQPDEGLPVLVSMAPLPSPSDGPLACSVPIHSSIAAMALASNPTSDSLPISPNGTYPGGRRRFTLGGVGEIQSLPLCNVHLRAILVYCRTDGVCICPECEVVNHQGHDTISVETEWSENKTRLGEFEQLIQEMIRQRIRKIEEIRMSVTELQLSAERETTGSLRVFSPLVKAVERAQAELMEVLDMSRLAAEHQADAMIRLLELEVTELRKRGEMLCELSQSEDHIHCVKSFPALCTPPPTKEWSGVSVSSNLGTGTIYRSLSALMEGFQVDLKSIAEIGFPASALEPSPVKSQPTIKRIQEYAVDVTLDSSTAHPRLILSDNLKQVKCGDCHLPQPNNPGRFDRVVCVLGREAFSTGRHYWEVEVGGKTDWDLGVARQSTNRKGKIEVTPSTGYWFLSFRDRNKCTFRTEPSTDVHLTLIPNKIGIFVDYEKGQVSFYNVLAKLHIYTFMDTFTENLYPFFSPCTNKSGKNNGPLIISPVSMIK